MKKLLIAFVVILTTQFGFAQDAAFKADVKKLIELTGANAQIEVAKKQVIAMIPADKHAQFTKEFEASLKPVMEVQEKFYLTEYTHDEVKQIIKYYESPIGKKVAEKSAKLTELTMPAIQEWSMELQGIIMKYQ